MVKTMAQKEQVILIMLSNIELEKASRSDIVNNFIVILSIFTGICCDYPCRIISKRCNFFGLVTKQNDFIHTISSIIL